MSKRQFKSQASSSRAASGTGFGGFGSASIGSTLSYLTEPPNFSSISDANVIVGFKNLSKKDGTTKSKALEDLRTYVQGNLYEQGGGTEEPILEAWAKFYPRISIDNSRRVRELAHNLQYDLMKSTRKRMEKHLPKIVGSWLAGTYDRDRAVSRAATDGISSFLDTDDKVLLFWKRCQVQILAYALEAIHETPQTLSDERTMNADDMQAKYYRVVGSSICLVVNLLTKLHNDDIAKHQDKYEDLLSNNKKIWAFACIEDSFVRKATDQLLMICLDKQTGIINTDLGLISHAFISEALRALQPTSALHLLQALEKLTSRFPNAWTSDYKGKKSSLSRLRIFVERGSQGGTPEYWQAFRSLLFMLPIGVLPTNIDDSLEFINAIRNGISSREESRNNGAIAWSSYFDVVELLGSKLSNSSLQGELYQKSIFPVFEQYLHPTAESIRWSIGNSISALAKAFKTCISVTRADIQHSFANDCQQLADGFNARILTSLPEQSKDYHKSQASVAAEGQRWFRLLSEVLKVNEPSTCHDLIVPSEKIITTALDTLVNRNGKPYSAAATLEVALRLTPTLMEVSPASLEAVKLFFESDLPNLIMSPSSPYLVASLNLLSSLPNQQAFFESVWTTVVDGILLNHEAVNKLAAITTLISSEAATGLTQSNLALQNFLLVATTRTVQGDPEAWQLFQAAVDFGSLTENTGRKLLDQFLEHLDANDSEVEGAFKALEFVSKRNPNLLKTESNAHVVLITKLLAMTEISDADLAIRARNLRSFIEDSNDTSSRVGPKESPIIHVIRENLETATSQSLTIETLVQQARTILLTSRDTETITALFPDTTVWLEKLTPLLDQAPNEAMAVMRPFAGAVFLVHNTLTEVISETSRDINGHSVALRMAMYAARLGGEFMDILPQELQVDILYLLGLTARLVSDQVDLQEQSKLFVLHLDPESTITALDLGFYYEACLSNIIPNAKNWLEDGGKRGPVAPRDCSPSVYALVSKYLRVSSGSRPIAFHAARALSLLLSKLVQENGWQKLGGEEWLLKLDILKPATTNVLGATAVLTGLQDSLGMSKTVNNLCNRLISDVAGASADSERTLGLLILLNASMAVYDEGDLPVAQNRLVFAVKQILSWTETLAATDSQLSAEACLALQRLLPAIKDTYGHYWETTVAFCVAIWDQNEKHYLSDSQLPAIGMSLKLFSILRNLQDANDDLEDALSQFSEKVTESMIKLLKLGRSKETGPLEFVDDLLSRLVVSRPSAHIKDLSEFYPLVASDFRMIQSAAFHILHRSLPVTQQQISVDVLLEKKDARLPEELLSLLLDAPSIHDLEDEELAEFPSSVRGYLLSWHLVYDSYTNASFKVRNDYSDMLKKENYIGPLLTFLFDVLGHSAANPIDLDKARFDASMIRSYNMWQAADSESNERSMQWLLINLYYLCLKFTPSLAKSWWVDCKSKQTRIAVESWTEKFFSPLVIQDTLDEVSKWSEEQDISEDEKELILKISKRSREVFAGYEVDDMQMQIVIRLPPNYPLEGVKVDGVNRVAVSEKKWTSWLRVTQGVITFSNGSISDGLTIFRKNVTGALKGQSECSICFSIISSDKKMPDKRCQTCKHLFHSSCLFKWFATSNQSTCPLCRNPFNYGTDLSRRARDRGVE